MTGRGWFGGVSVVVKVMTVVLVVVLALGPSGAFGAVGVSGASGAVGDSGAVGASGRTGAADLPGSAGGAGWGGARAWPVGGPGGVLGRFEPPAKVWAAGHRGVDLAAEPGVEVRTAAPGVVAFSGLVAGRPVVTVAHPGSGSPPLRTTYLPVTGTVPVGTPVAAGQPIGLLAPDGRHCAGRDCLHWGLLRGSRYLDPLALFGAGTARLLPLRGADG
ncbi:peptidoglycan DD-metalloendopeptidase family protein [Kitasatospora sp. NPDC127067]|uniref:peptidoglycan DD-metalloendopeptidase family protein n=1 Tax=Kitasatospora sp. NPDC127067 TaxID=3347126 RepID=UPI003666AF89